jgi:hypothetical protein
MSKGIGSIRRFDNYSGLWQITEIQENISKNYKYTFTKLNFTCPHCGKSVVQTRDFHIIKIETLKQEEKTLHLGISDTGNYVILEEAEEI